jgi:hypothetical protein
MHPDDHLLYKSQPFPIAARRSKARWLNAARNGFDETLRPCSIVWMPSCRPGPAEDKTTPLWSLLLGLAIVVFLAGYCLRS